MDYKTPFKDAVVTDSGTKPATGGKADPMSDLKPRSGDFPIKQTQDIPKGDVNYNTPFKDAVVK